MQILIRKALPEDAYDYTDCFISCLQTAYRGIVSDGFIDGLPFEREQRAEKFRKNSAKPEIETYCVIFGDKMIGFLAIHKTDGEIWAVYLLEEFRRMDYGKIMLDFAAGELKRAGYKKVFL